MEDIYHYNADELKIPRPLRADWFVNVIVSFQADLIYNTLLVLTSPIAFSFSLAFNSYRRAAAIVTTAENAVKTAPSKATLFVSRVVRRTWFGILGACHVSMVLMVVMAVATVAGVGMVRMYMEEPVAVREKLFFDYTEVNPTALFRFETKKKPVGVPMGHVIHVSLELLMPESDFNRDLGLFQLKTELLSAKGETITKSSQPCMLTFRSLPIRLARTFTLSVPLVVGVSSETQMIKVDVLRHKERNPRARAVRVTLIPRARTLSVPQLYEAQMVINSRPPWIKRMVYSWKWTLCVWTSMGVYIILLVALICCCRPLLYHVPASRTSVVTHNITEMEGTSKARDRRSRRKTSISIEVPS